MTRTALNLIVMYGVAFISIRLLILAKRRPQEHYMDFVRVAAILTLIIVVLDVVMVLAL